MRVTVSTVIKLLPFIAVILLAGCASQPPLRTVKSVNLESYSGQWHEIARYPNWFQRNCAGRVTADYVPRKDGSITVVNSCARQDGSVNQVKGRAKVVPGSGNAKLKVFFGGPIAGDYWIIGLDREYQWALVGHPSRRYLWILARSPGISEKLYAQIVQSAVEQGYDASRIVKTPQ